MPLVEYLLAMITDRDHGRIQGFLAAFREEGMDAQVDSWVAEGPGEELSGTEVETGLGPGLVEEIGQRFGLDAGQVAAALGFLIPRILDALTPGGDVPDEELLLARVEALGAGVGSAVPAAPAAPPRQADMPPEAPPTAPSEVPPAEPPVTPPEVPPAVLPDVTSDEEPRRPGALAWLLPLIVLLALVWWAARQCAPESRTDGDPPRAAAAPSERAAAEPSEAAGLRAGRAPQPPAETPTASANEAGPAPESEPDPDSAAQVELDREVEAQAEAEAATATAAPPADAAVPDTPAAGDGGAGLAALAPDFTTEELVAALNRGSIDFAPSSAAISSDGRALLEEAARAILALPSGTRLEIAGHTDGAGEPRRNQRLSQARAEAVRNVLVEYGVPSTMLVPRGYGSSRPVASDDTAEGRRQNRRIEFTLLEAGER